jgi:CHAT domain-containing protein
MRWCVRWALLAGVLLQSCVALHAGVRAHDVSDRRALSSTLQATNKGNSFRSSEADRGSAVLLKKAEAGFQKAIVLREKQSGKDLIAAAGRFGESARLFESAHANERAADAHFHAGEIYSTLSQYDKARRSFRKALQLGQGPELRCKALSRIARTYATTGPFSFANQYSNEAMRFCEPLSEGAQAEALEARGEALDFGGDRSNNEDYYLRAQNLFAAAKDENGQAQALLMLAYRGLFSGGNYEQGLEAAREALRLWYSVGNRHGIAKMRSILGTSAILRGEFETAQCNYKVSRPVFREIGNMDDEGSVLNGLGNASGEIGDWQKSLQYYQSARTIFASVQDQLGELEAINGMGKALTALKYYSSLLPLYAAELRVARKTGDPLTVAYAFQDMAAAYEAAHQYVQAETFYRRSLESYRATQHLYSEGDVLIRLGHLQATRKQYSQAIASLERANALEGKLGQVAEAAKVGYELAYIYRRLNRLEDALSAIEESIDIVEKQRLTISHFDSRASYFAAVHKYYALYVQLLMLADRKKPARGFAEKAFDISERSKVRSLLDLLTASSQDAPCDELLERQLRIRPTTEVRAAVAEQTVSPHAAQILTVKQVQAEIEGDDAVLVEYVLGDEKSYLWVVDQHQVSSYELPQAQRIRNLVESFRKTLVPSPLMERDSVIDYQEKVRKQDQAYGVYARQLSKLLLGPIAQVRAKRVLIVPDGSLQYLPFAALPVPAAGGDELLLNRYEVSILPSASLLGTLRKSNATRPPPTAAAVIFADPVFGPDDPRVVPPPTGDVRRTAGPPPALSTALRDMDASAHIARLPASREEANAIAQILGFRDPEAVHVALDFAASREYVLRDGLSRFRLVHFATHGVVDSRHPEMSGLILSLIDRKGRKRDGYLRLGDIYKLKLSADLVVLSSCDSALGEDLESEGIIGLPRGFLYAGAKSVIASLWKVNDEATARLMSRLYARIHRGETPSSALRGAQLEMVRDPQWSKPYYWAAFVLQGEYK